MATNPRYHNGNYRRKLRARLRAMDAPCGICHGALGPILYEQKSCADNPLSFCVDEIRPISKYYLYGYGSPEEAAMDPSNTQAAHWCCNAKKSNKIPEIDGIKVQNLPNIKDGDW